MNLPNKLTMLRMLMIPLFLLFFYMQSIPLHALWALLLFAGAALTDLVDGRIARSRGLITDFGKLMDPLADKLLVMSAMLCFVSVGWVHAVVVVVILSREFLVTSIRLLAAGKGKVLAADQWGKLKTVAQMVWICVGLTKMLLLSLAVAPTASGSYFLLTGVFSGTFSMLTWVVALLTVCSGIHYIRQNQSLFLDA